MLIIQFALSYLSFILPINSKNGSLIAMDVSDLGTVFVSFYNETKIAMMNSLGQYQWKHTRNVTGIVSISITDNDETILEGSENGIITLINGQDYSQLSSSINIQSYGRVNSIDITTNRSNIALGGDIWALYGYNGTKYNPYILFDISNPFILVQFGGDNQHLIFASIDGYLQIINVINTNTIQWGQSIILQYQQLLAAAISNDSNTIVVGGIGNTSKVYVRNQTTDTYYYLKNLEKTNVNVTSLSINNNGSYIVVGYANSSVIIYLNYVPYLTINACSSLVLSVSITNDAQNVYIGCNNNQIYYVSLLNNITHNLINSNYNYNFFMSSLTIATQQSSPFSAGLIVLIVIAIIVALALTILDIYLFWKWYKGNNNLQSKQLQIQSSLSHFRPQNGRTFQIFSQ